MQVQQMGWKARQHEAKRKQARRRGRILYCTLQGGRRLEGNGLDCYRVVLPQIHETEREGYLADGIRGWRELGWTVRVVLPKGHETERAGYRADGIRGWREMGWTVRVVLPKGHEPEKGRLPG